jgi:hypothetical protein
MSILVICPGCHKRYQVKDKFAGKSGHCPNCRHPIIVPDKAIDLKIHAPEEFEQGGRDTSNKLVLKPIAREEIKFNPLVAAYIVSIAAVMFTGAFYGGNLGLFKDNLFITAASLALISPLLAMAGYALLYDEELEPYKGIEFFIRSAICGLIYTLFWGVFASISAVVLTGEVWNWVFIAPPFLAAGAMVSATLLDLEFGNGLLHYSFYLIITIILRWAAGMDWIWNINRL